MKKLLHTFLSLAVLVWMASFAALAAPGRSAAEGHGKGKATHGKKVEHKKAKAEHGKPDEKGLEHASEVASPQGVEHGIEKAEAKQAAHEAAKAGAGKESKGKHKAKGKEKKAGESE